jgi:hypothetical protein
MAAPDASNRSGTLRSRVLAVGELRDAVLFLATAIYVLGYVTWAIYSADQGLGVLPPLEGQYFLAGLVPLVLLAVALAALAAIVPPADARARGRAKKWGSIIMAVALAPAVILASVDYWVDVSPALEGAVLVFVVFGTYVGMGLKIRSGEAGTGGWMVWLFRLAILASAVSGLLIYATLVFPMLPRELGGPRPFCVELDVTAASISPATLASLKPVAGTTSAATVRSGPLWLHFDGGGALVLSQGRGRPVPLPFRVSDSAVPVVLSSTGCQG